MSKFDRSIGPELERAIAAEADRAGWWRDVLDDRTLLIALRGTYLNVYWQGQSIFRVTLQGLRLNATTHEKYLVDPALADQVPLNDDGFDVSRLVQRGFIRTYDGPATLEKLKASASKYSGAEKRGVHAIAIRNPTVVDVEIAFPGVVGLPGDDPDAATKSPRVDIAAFEPIGDAVRLVFWEAKLFANGELRAIDGADIPVCRQIATYQQYIRENRDALEASYRLVATNLYHMSQSTGRREVHPLIKAVHDGTKLTVGDEPKVGLVVFGFDSAQRDHDRWKRLRERLEQAIPHFKAAGSPASIKLPQ